MDNGTTTPRELIELVLDSSTTDAEILRLAEHIEQHPEIVEELAEELFIHELLVRASQG